MTDIIIPSDSCHPHEHKYGAIQYMVNRMNTHLLNKSNKELECNIINKLYTTITMIHLFWINPTEPNRQHDTKGAIQTIEPSSHI